MQSYSDPNEANHECRVSFNLRFQSLPLIVYDPKIEIEFLVKLYDVVIVYLCTWA